MNVCMLPYYSYFSITVAYEELNELMTWENAKDNCTLVTPKFDFQGQILTVNIVQNLTDDEFGMWLGYYRKFRGFEYIGNSFTN